MLKIKSKKYAFTFLFLLSFFSKGLCSSEREPEEVFESAFAGSSPFYAVTVARSTLGKVYEPLTSQDEAIILSVLSNLFSGTPAELLDLSRQLI